jgi:poly-beta-1,6-N-acetyl-D-glucosamine synthase
MYIILMALSKTTLVFALLFVISFLIVWEFGGYPLLMTIASLRSKPQTKDYSFQPFVSIIVPTYNEELCIETRIYNLYLQNYPKRNYELIVVDSASTDSTTQIVQRLIEENKAWDLPRLRLLREQQRNGKGSAILLGQSQAKGDTILVTDANCTFNLDAVRELMPHFQNPQVGAVGGRYVVSNPDNALTLSTKFYRDLEHLLRTGEAALCSAVLFDGELNAWKKGAVDIDPHRPTEDFEMCIKFRKEGYKIEYEPEAIVYEAAPTSLREQVKQRTKNSVGTIASILHNFQYLVVPADLYRLLLMPSHKGLAIVSPFLMLAVPALYLVAFDWGLVWFHALTTVIIFLMTFAAMTFVRSRLGAGYRTEQITIAGFMRIILYTLLSSYIVLLSWKSYITGNYSARWDMVKTTRNGGSL